MASIISLNTIPDDIIGVNNLVNNTGLTNNTIFANTVRLFVTDDRFGSLFANNSVNGSKLTDLSVIGNKMVNQTLSGARVGMGQLAWYTIAEQNMANNSVVTRTIPNNEIPNSKLALMPGNSVKTNISPTNGTAVDLVLPMNSVPGRSTGNVQSLNSTTNTVLRNLNDSLGFGKITEDIIQEDQRFIPGMIMMWAGTIANIPSGWGFCNGATYTFNSRTTLSPDLRDRFIVGSFTDFGNETRTNITGILTKTGGSNTHSHSQTIPQNALGITATATGGTVLNTTLTLSQIPDHGHTATVTSDGQHYHSYAAGGNLNFLGAPWLLGTNGNFGGGTPDDTSFIYRTGMNISSGTLNNAVINGSHTHTVSVGNAGGGGAHTHGFTNPTITAAHNSYTINFQNVQNIPTYYALAYIIKL